MPKPTCSNPNCRLHGQSGRGNIVRHGFFPLGRARRRRFRCKTCGKTFCSAQGTPYYRLHCTRRDFDEVAAMSVEGVSRSAIARIKAISWNTVARWLERAAVAAREFNDRMTRGYELREVQADEIKTFLSNKDSTTWILTTIEVWSRLWPSTVVGARSYRNVRRVMADTSRRGRFEDFPLTTTDGYSCYTSAIGRIFVRACVYGQVIKTRRNDRVIRVDRRLAIGSPRTLEDALERSEDSEALNTSFIERMNLTLRQGTAYLCRRSACHARSSERLADHLELLRCFHNFVRPHRRLRFGNETRTPAMQAGLASRRLSFREVFTSVAGMLLYVLIVIDFRRSCQTVKRDWAAA